jgi:nitroreductase
MLQKLIIKNRSYRRFFEMEKISKEELIECIDAARLSPSPRNQQALKFLIVNDPDQNSKLFSLTAWAGALSYWHGPEEGERPSAYIIILGDNSIVEHTKKSYHEVASGIAAQSIMLAAVEKGLGGCMIAALKRKQIRELLKIEKHYDILLVLAIGKPKEKVVIEEMPQSGNYNYWRDKKNVHHVPKRSLQEIILNFK